MNVRSISFRLVVWYTSLLTGIFLVLGLLFYVTLQHFVENDLRVGQLFRAHQIVGSLIAHLQPDKENLIAGEMESLYQPESAGRFIRVSRADGTIIYCSGAPADGGFDPASVPRQTGDYSAEVYRKLSLPNGKKMILGGVSSIGQSNTRYFVEVGRLLDPVEDMLNTLFFRLALGLPLAAAIIAGGGWLLVRMALKPVEEIAQAAELITQHNTGERMPVARTGDELERLSVSLNRMIARLDDAFQNSRRFLADASHELRTPLTILHGELEMLAEDSRLQPDVRDQIGSLLEEVERLGKIVDQLLALSRLDAGEAQTEWKSFDLAELARTTADQMNLLAEDKGISIVSEMPQAVLIDGDCARLKQVVVNLLDNAIKYTPSKGSIHLRVRIVNGRAVLEVEDNGGGIPSEALPHVFDRFFRVDPARSADPGSAGLGLSIVKSICTAHGAEVEADSAPNRGSCFRVKLPLSKQGAVS